MDEWLSIRIERALDTFDALAAHVGRIADAAERIADNTAPPVSEKPNAPARDFIGIPAERDA